MASEVSIFGAEDDRAPTVEELKRELVEALDRQTATAEVLRIISSSPSGVKPVFNAILVRAVSLCNAAFGVIFRFDGELIHVVAHQNSRHVFLA
jgi:two-component system, NtrC family, sensor kinase